MNKFMEFTRVFTSRTKPGLTCSQDRNEPGLRTSVTTDRKPNDQILVYMKIRILLSILMSRLYRCALVKIHLKNIQNIVRKTLEICCSKSILSTRKVFRILPKCVLTVRYVSTAYQFRHYIIL